MAVKVGVQKAETDATGKERTPPFSVAVLRSRPVLAFLLHSAIYHIGLFGIPDVLTNFYLVSLGFVPDQIGLLLSLSRVSGLLTGLPVGLLAGRVPEKTIISASAAGVAASLALMLVSPAFGTGGNNPAVFWGIAASRFLLGFFYGAGQIAQAPLLVRLAPAEHVSALFAWHNITSMGATAFGSLIGGVLPAFLVGAAARSPEAQTTAAYGWGLATCVAIVAASIMPLWVLREAKSASSMTQPQQAERAPFSLRASFRAPWGMLLVLSLPMLLFGFTGGLTFPFYNLFFREMFGAPDGQVGAILGYGWLGMALVPMLNPALERRLGSPLALGLLMSIAAAAFFLLGVVDVLAASIVCYVVAVSVRNCMQPLFQPLLMRHLSPALHGLGSSVGLVLWNVGWFAATNFSGQWQTTLGYGAIMQIAAVGVFITGWLVYLLYRKRQPSATIF